VIILLIFVILFFYIILKSPESGGNKQTDINYIFKTYDLFYADQKNKKFSEDVIISKILISEKYNLRGKPDFIFKHKKKPNLLLPVELKSGSIKDAKEPHYGDMMQLVAYFLIIEDCFGVVPPEGMIAYKDRIFVIKNVPEIRKMLLDIIEDMEYMLETGEGDVKPSFVKCRYCMCRGTVCEFCKTS